VGAYVALKQKRRFWHSCWLIVAEFSAVYNKQTKRSITTCNLTRI